MKFICDLFKGVNGASWELARVMSGWALGTYTGTYIAALAWKGTIPDPSAFGVGLAAVMAGCGAMIGIKDIARAKANSTDPTTGA